MQVRAVKIEDAASILSLMYRLDDETNLMLLEPGERQTSLEQQTSILESFIESTTQTMFVAADESDILGFIVGLGSTANRNKHSMYCVIGIQQSATRKGLGTKLLTQLEAWAIEHDFTRMELTVMCHNQQAKHLYLSRGFEIEGTKIKSLCVDGEYVDEYCMSKILIP